MVGSRNALSPAQRQFFKSIKMQEVSLNVAWKMAVTLSRCKCEFHVDRPSFTRALWYAYFYQNNEWRLADYDFVNSVINDFNWFCILRNSLFIHFLCQQFI